MPDLAELEDRLAITETREAALELQRRRLTVNHSLTLHRDSVSAADVKEMIAYLESAGMPAEATLRVDGSGNHTRMYASWSSIPSEGTETNA